MKHNTHHLKGDSTIPAWLWFALYNSEPNQKWTDQKEKLALEINDNEFYLAIVKGQLIEMLDAPIVERKK